MPGNVPDTPFVAPATGLAECLPIFGFVHSVDMAEGHEHAPVCGEPFPMAGEKVPIQRVRGQASHRVPSLGLNQPSQ